MKLRETWTEEMHQVRTLRDWAQRLGLSERELTRAVQCDALVHHAKRDGRDHGARLVRASDLRGFLETIEAVERNGVHPPRWWRAVRKRAA